MASAESKFIVEKIDTSDAEVNQMIMDRVMSDLKRYPFREWEEVRRNTDYYSKGVCYGHPRIHYQLLYYEETDRHGYLSMSEQRQKGPQGKAWVDGFQYQPENHAKELFLHLHTLLKEKEQADREKANYDITFARRVRRFFQSKNPKYASEKDALYARMKSDTMEKYVRQMMALLEKHPAWEWVEKTRDHGERSYTITWTHSELSYELVEHQNYNGTHAHFIDIAGSHVFTSETTKENTLIVEKWQSQLRYHAESERQKKIQTFLNTSFND